ncbi:MAG: hypothetical protein WCE64_15325 [Bacteroidales bacterium]
MNPKRKLVYWFLLLAGLLFGPGCTRQYSQGDGLLEGKISIGPLCPVEQNPPQPGCLPTAETYIAWPVDIWTANGRTELLRINPLVDGSYKIELPAGRYLVRLDVTHFGSTNLPTYVEIVTGETTDFNINIDTGIR